MPKKKIKHEIPQPGSVFEKIFRDKRYSLKVIKTKDGIMYEVGGHQFLTPTAAAKHIQGSEVNGWKFWKIDKK